MDGVAPEIIGVTSGWHRFGRLGNQGRLSTNLIDNEPWNAYVKSLTAMLPDRPATYEGRMHNVVLNPLKGPKGHQFIRYNPEVTQSSKYAYEITKSCKYPEVAIRWADYLQDPVISFQMMNGPIGTHITDKGDGTFILIDRPPSAIYPGDWQNNFAFGGGPGGNSDIFEKRIDLQDITIWNQRDDKNAYKPFYPKEYYPNLAFSPEELDELVIFRQDITTFSKSQFARWIVNGGIEAEYAGFVQRLNSMGLSRMIQIYQTAYDRYMKI
jgi:putative aldouronate transport system substrate-binding protein